MINLHGVSLNSWMLLLLVLVMSWLATYFFRNYAISTGMVDAPNSRSSHSKITPRGGGVGFVVVFFLSMVFLYSSERIDPNLFYALIGGGLLIAIMGWADDHRHVPAKYRLVVHFIGAAWVVFILGDEPSILFPEMASETINMLLKFILVIILVWVINLYNFMDGIDGIASIELISVCIPAAGLSWMLGASLTVWLPPLVLAVSVLGFLFWNFPVAKVFMGDAGSGFLGMLMAVFALYSASFSPELLWAWLILLGVFITDATMTLTRRVLAGKNFTQAHNSHAYQKASRRYHSHVKVSLAVLLINLCWLLPIAYITSMGLIRGSYAVFFAFVPLVILGFIYKAGLDE